MGEAHSLNPTLKKKKPRGLKISHVVCSFSEIMALLLIRKDTLIKMHLKVFSSEGEKQYSGRLPFEAVNTFHVI